MKKFSVLLAIVLVVSLFAGCAGTPVVYNCTCPTGEAAPAVTEGAGENAPAAEGAVKTGLAAVTSVAKSKAATAEEEGAADYDVTMVAVTVDDDGIIQDCIIDGIKTSVKFDTTGAITTDLTAPVATKNELGENYGMVAYGGAIAEWDEQAAALASYAVGKTVEELKSGAIDETGKAPAGSDLASSATIYLGGYVSAIETAVAGAQHLGAQAGDTLKLVSSTSLGKSAAADAENAGNAQLDTTVMALTMNGETITSASIDAVQAKVAFDATGAVTSDVTAPVPTKNELGEGYGMKAYGNAIAEWNEQAASFASYITGKTAAEVAGIAVDEATAPTDADLTASVTIKIGGFQALVAKAAAETEATPAVEGAVKTGMAVVTSLGKSASATEEAPATIDFDVTMVAVNVDDNGVIVGCVIDGIKSTVKAEQDAEGNFVTFKNPVQTKNELGEAYGMVAYGGAIAEWDEQAAALASYAVGKTVDELKNGAIDETGRAPEGSDLASSATIYLGGYVSAIEQAVANAQNLGAQAGDELKLVADTTVFVDNIEEEDRHYSNTQLDSTIMALTMNGETITSAAIDAVQAKVEIEEDGTISTDVTAPVATKNELGENYGMKAWGGAIAEWNEQAASFASYITGKTPAEVAGIAVNEKTAPTEADLTASVTIAIGGFQALVAKAANE